MILNIINFYLFKEWNPQFFLLVSPGDSYLFIWSSSSMWSHHPSTKTSFLVGVSHIFQFPNKRMLLKLTEQFCELLHLLISLPVFSWMSNWKILNWVWQCMPVIWDVEAEESEVQGPLELHSKFGDSQNYTRPCFKQASEQTQEQIKNTKIRR